jgi:CBS domain-containing protein
MVKVKDIMIREVKCCAPGDNLNYAAHLMWENDCGCVPVLDGDLRTVGMLTDRDVCMAAYTQGRSLKDIQVSSAMSREVFACQPNDEISTVRRLMSEHGVRRLPVTDENEKLVGIVSLTDIAHGVSGTTAGEAEIATTLVAICAPHRAHMKQQSDNLKDDHEAQIGTPPRRPRRRNKPPPKGASR